MQASNLFPVPDARNIDGPTDRLGRLGALGPFAKLYTPHALVHGGEIAPSKIQFHPN
jgi:hypothetical protein